MIISDSVRAMFREIGYTCAPGANGSIICNSRTCRIVIDRHLTVTKLSGSGKTVMALQPGEVIACARTIEDIQGEGWYWKDET